MPVDFVIEALAKIMRSNIFQFGDTYWKQTRGCAMGTSTAVNYAYLYVCLLEVQRLLPRYKTCLLFFKRFIDDGIRVWLPPSNDQLTWDAFLRCLNQWGTLRWTCNGHVDSLIFMDLWISIGPDRHLIFQTYQKPMNLYLYMPPGSVHPGKMLRSLIFGRLRTYWLQNTHLRDFYVRHGSAPCSLPDGPRLLVSDTEASLQRSLRQTPSPAQPTTRDTPPTARPK
jgi:hypothetical protein